MVGGFSDKFNTKNKIVKPTNKKKRSETFPGLISSYTVKKNDIRIASTNRQTKR